MNKPIDLRQRLQEDREEDRAPERKLRLSEREEKLIRMIREVQFGEIQLHIADGQPVRLEEVRKSIKL